jgi:two-component system cell cycle sensor histidine kinase PleC
VFTASPAQPEIASWAEAALPSALPGLAPLLVLAAVLAGLHAAEAKLREAQARLRTSQEDLAVADERYRLASEGARAGIFEWLTATETLTLSDQIVTLLRAPAATMTVGQLVHLAPAEDRPAIEAAFETARAGGPLEASFRVAAGHTIVWVELRGVPVEDASGEIRIVGTALDVTARREAELRAQALQRRLREAIESFSGPFALWDTRRRLVMWNKSFQDLFRLQASLLRPGVSYDAVAMACAAAIRREHADSADSTNREVELLDGAWLKVQERRTTEGGMLTIGVDISAIKRQRDALAQSETTMKHAITKLELSEGRNRELARSFEEQKRRAEDASRAKSAFLANMSHELRTPLNAVIGFSEIMSTQLFGPLGDERYVSYAKDIHASGQLLLDLINDVLDMAKIEAGKLNLSPRPLDPLDAVEQAVRLVRRRAEEKGLQLLVDAPDLPEIEADHRAVKQMLLNLLSNAVKFTEKGGILVEARATRTGISLRVIDTGRGIPKEHLHRLARPFEQVESDQAREQPGTGLGLALTKSLAEMHGGRLELESQEGRGTVVTIYLPLRFGVVEEAVAAE